MKKILFFLTLLLSPIVLAQGFWTQLHPFPNNNNCRPMLVSAAGSEIVWTIGNEPGNESSGIYKWALSADRGTVWSQGNINLGNPDLRISSVFAVSATTAYVTVYPLSTEITGGVWVTYDSGLNWSKQTTALFNNPQQSFPDFAHFWNPQKGITVGDPENGYFEIYLTEDGGTNWNRISAENIPPALQNEYGIISKYEFSENNFWFATNLGRLFKSSDHGLTWQVLQTPIQDFGGLNTLDIAFKNDLEGILISNQWEFHYTTDGGETWQLRTDITGDYRNGSVWNIPETNGTYLNGGTGLITGNNGASFTTNNGTDWTDVAIFDENPVVPLHAAIINNNIGYCIGFYASEDGLNSNYSLFKFAGAELKTESFRKNRISATPNPANNNITIHGVDIIGVKLFDTSGKNVLDRNFTPTTVVLLDLENLESGIYSAGITDVSGSIMTTKIIKK